ncbi:hypothetical protein [Kamptonema formosum]|uniref:hypothetical protein n=1 Tax=Kamptonema formosum TaxID=331992 RepID=UPI00034D518E|nr:hypothetical protein [Oscillatoria sp. PCC 10802]
MDKQRIEAYLNLIQELLSCPREEQPEIWRANSHLVERGLVAVMEVVNADMIEEGELNAI